MDDMEDKLNSILGNPQMMQQIMSMAQMLGQTQGESKPQTEPPQPSPPQKNLTAMDPAMLQKIYNIARQSGIDKDQQNLLKALSPYLSRDRLGKLERAMRAAKIAGIASGALSGSGLAFLTGR